MKKIERFWNWYDNIEEPYRFAFAMFFLCSPFIVGNAIVDKHRIIGSILMLLEIPIVASRIHYTMKNQ